MCGEKMKITKEEAFTRMWKGEVLKNDLIRTRIFDGNLQFYSSRTEEWKRYDINFNSLTLSDDWSTIEEPEDAFKEYYAHEVAERLTDEILETLEEMHK